MFKAIMLAKQVGLFTVIADKKALLSKILDTDFFDCFPKVLTSKNLIIHPIIDVYRAKSNYFARKSFSDGFSFGRNNLSNLAREVDISLKPVLILSTGPFPYYAQVYFKCKIKNKLAFAKLIHVVNYFVKFDRKVTFNLKITYQGFSLSMTAPETVRRGMIT